MTFTKFLTKTKCATMSSALSICFLVGVSSPAHAEDIEIFTNAFNADGSGIVGNPDFQPNVLLIVDNSTSMGRTGAIPDPNRQGVEFSVARPDRDAVNGSSDNPTFTNNPNNFCGRSHSGATGRANDGPDGTGTKNRYFRYRIAPGANRWNVSRCETRFDTLQRSLTEVLASDADPVFDGFSIGLMRMNRNTNSGNSGGTIVDAVLPLAESNNRASLLTIVDELDFGQSTPVAETLYEGYLYFSGNAVDNGFITQTFPGGNQAEAQTDFTDTSLETRAGYQTDPVALNGNNYRSPIQNQCQDNTIVFLSDGLPTNDDNNDNDIEALISADNCSGGDCSDEIAEYMNTAGNVEVTRGAGGSAETIESRVNVVTIGLNIDSQVLRDIGAAGTGVAASNVGQTSPATVVDGENVTFDEVNRSIDYYTVSQPNQLAQVFADIFSNLGSDEPALFAAPAISVDSFNRLTNRSEVYFALFQPEANTRWPGNVKRYNISVDSDDLEDGEAAVILDVNDNRALTDEGVFADTAVSEWTDPATPDGNEVGEGAAAANLVTPRRLFGRVGNATPFLSNGAATQAVNNFLSIVGAGAGSAISLGEIGDDDAQLEQNRLDIARFSLNVNAEDDAGDIVNNGYLGDNLHGDPYVLTFAGDGTTDSPFEDVIFYTSNQGMLHAIDGEDGSEMWAYLPDESLFENLGAYANSVDGEKVYGLDSEIAFSIVRNGATQEVDEAVLFFGQRRGGNKLFAVDVSNARQNAGTPFQHLWTIDAGSEPALSQLGQTWAQPVVTRVNVCDNGGAECPQLVVNAGLTEAQLDNVAPEVLFVSGGYDEQYDVQLDDSGNLVEVADLAGSVRGNALYMINAETGDVLWMASDEITGPGLVIPEMVHSVVARPTVLDTDFNGVSDTIFFADISGQVFRIDFRTAPSDTEDVLDDASSVSGGRIANLRAANDDRLFFNSLNVAILPPNEGDPAVANDDVPLRYVIATGSGYRAHPLDDEVDGNFMHVMYDENITLPLSDGGSPSYEYYCTGSQADDPTCTGATPRVYGPADFQEAVLDGVAALQTAVTAPADPDANNIAIDSISFDGSLPLQVGYRVPTSFGGEKVITPALINGGALSYTSYIPAAANASNFADNCVADLGTGLFYSFDLENGEFFVEILDSPGIPTQPVTLDILDPNGVPVNLTLVGREIIQSPDLSGGPGDDDDDDTDTNPNDLGKANRSVWWETDRAE